MARRNLRKAYEFKLGKERASKLSDEQINLLSKYYNSLSESEQSSIDNAISQGRTNDLSEMADAFIAESEESVVTESPEETIPEGLDDLLKSIQEVKEKVEDKPEDKSGALVVYEPTRDEELVDEEVDERILNILGLDDVVGIDYGTYKTLLKEKMVAGRMTDSQMPTEEVELLTNEYKRVKSETGRFKIRKKKISVESFTEEPQKAETKPQKAQVTPLLPGVNLKKEEEEQEEQKEEDKKQTDSIENLKTFVERSLVPALSKIEKNLEGIISTIEKQVELESKQEKKERIAAEKTKKRVREEKSETPKENKFAKTLDKITKPVKGFIERIIEILSSFLIGSGLLRLIDILKDPMGYLDRIVDWANGIIKGIEDQIKKLITPFYDSVNSVISQINRIGQSIEDTLNSVRSLFGQQPDDDIFTPIDPVEIPDKILPRIPDPNPETGPDAKNPQQSSSQSSQPQSSNSQPAQQLTGGGEVINIQNISYQGGGDVNKDSGITITGMGPDTQLIAAQPGEIVMSKKAVDAYGADTLLSMNKEAGGTNIPKFGKIKGFQGGGQVGKLVIGAGHAPSEDNAMKGIALGSDGLPVQGTQDFKTGVPEWKATRHLVKTLKGLVSNNPALSSRISFENITAEKGDKGLRGVPARVEQQSNTQYVDIHFDARGGRAGVLRPETNRVSSVDRAMASVFGNYPGIKPLEKGVTAAGGTILEVAAIDDPSIAMYLGEVKKGTIGKESTNLANKVLNSMLPGLKNTPTSTQATPSTSAPVPESTTSNVKPGAGMWTPDGFLTPEELTERMLTTPQSPQVRPPAISPITQLTPQAPQVRPTLPPTPTPIEVTPQTPPSRSIKPPSSRSRVIPLPIPSAGGGSQKGPILSGSGANQKQAPSFSSTDVNNPELIVVKAIYNIVGN